MRRFLVLPLLLAGAALAGAPTVCFPYRANEGEWLAAVEEARKAALGEAGDAGEALTAARVRVLDLEAAGASEAERARAWLLLGYLSRAVEDTRGVVLGQASTYVERGVALAPRDPALRFVAYMASSKRDDAAEPQALGHLLAALDAGAEHDPSLWDNLRRASAHFEGTADDATPERLREALEARRAAALAAAAERR